MGRNDLTNFNQLNMVDLQYILQTYLVVVWITLQATVHKCPWEADSLLSGKKFPVFCGTYGLLLFTQDPTTGPSSKSAEFISHNHFMFL
jgi:hypothetical protein